MSKEPKKPLNPKPGRGPRRAPRNPGTTVRPICDGMCPSNRVCAGKRGHSGIHMCMSNDCPNC